MKVRDPLLEELEELGRLDDGAEALESVVDASVGSDLEPHLPPVSLVSLLPVDGPVLAAGKPLPVAPAHRRVTGGKAQASPGLQEPDATWFSRDEPGVLDALVREVGCFYVRSEGLNRWRCFNRFRGHQHITYGVFAEVAEQLLVQTELWEQKFAESGSFSKGSWRKTMTSKGSGSS